MDTTCSLNKYMSELAVGCHTVLLLLPACPPHVVSPPALWIILGALRKGLRNYPSQGKPCIPSYPNMVPFCILCALLDNFWDTVKALLLHRATQSSASSSIKRVSLDLLCPTGIWEKPYQTLRHTAQYVIFCSTYKFETRRRLTNPATYHPNSVDVQECRLCI